MQNTYHRQTAKLVAKIAENMPEEMTVDVMQGWIQNPKALQKALRSVLVPPQAQKVVLDYGVWKTIQLGTLTVKALREDLLLERFKIGDWASDILNKVTIAKLPTKVDLANFSVKELGEATGQDFSQGARYDAICRAIRQIGELCPAEVGPQLRLQYADQPNGEWIVVAMEPITDSLGGPGVFDVGRDGDDRWLNAVSGDADYFWNPDRRFAFVRRK